jgi:hypothetical protein
LRIVERFNYAQINNLGAKSSDQEFLLFLDNDVLVSQSSWLRLIMDECRADEKVGAVGCKLFYPNGMVQHAGWCWAPVALRIMRFAGSAATHRVI